MIEDAQLQVDPEMARIWNEEEDVDFVAMRANEDPTPSSEAEEADEAGEPDTEPEASTEETSEEEPAEEADTPEAEETEETKPNTYKVKADGMDFEFTTEELLKLAPKAIDYSKKTMALAPYRKRISAMEEAGLTDHDVNLMIDVMKGDKNAIAEVLKRTKVDPLELDTDGKDAYVPNSYGKDETVLAIEEIVAEISKDKEYETTQRIVDDLWDSASRMQMRENPALIRGLHEEVQMGRYTIVAPMAAKMKTMDLVNGVPVKSDLEYYQNAVNVYIEQSATTEKVNTQVQRQESIKEKAPARKAAAPTKQGTGKKTAIDYLDDGDEDYDTWYKSIMSKV